MKWGEVFPNPSHVGETEYRAIHTAAIQAVFDCQGDEYPSDVEIPAEAMPLLSGVLCQFSSWADDLLVKLGTKPQTMPEANDAEQLVPSPTAVIPKEMHVVKDGAFAPEDQGSVMFLSVASSDLRLLQGQGIAKKFAYEARAQFGYENSGIDYLEGPIPVTADYAPDTDMKTGRQRYAGWVVRFRLTRGL
jgi:hypothetical protein